MLKIQNKQDASAPYGRNTRLDDGATDGCDAKGIMRHAEDEQRTSQESRRTSGGAA